MMMMPRVVISGTQFTGSGFICCPGVSTEGEVFRLQDPAAFGSTLADLVATGTEAQVLRDVADQMIITNVSGMIISPPNALRPRVRVTSAASALMMAPMLPFPLPGGPPAPTPTPTPTPAPTPRRPTYSECVQQCIASKVPGLALEEVINNACGPALIALEASAAAPMATVPLTQLALAFCVAATFGLSVGAVLECFTACIPGGRLTPEFMGGGSGVPNLTPAAVQDRMTRLTRIASAVHGEAARRGVQVTPSQVISILMPYAIQS